MAERPLCKAVGDQKVRMERMNGEEVFEKENEVGASEVGMSHGRRITAFMYHNRPAFGKPFWTTSIHETPLSRRCLRTGSR
jgi:hypothetical protein